MMTKTSDNSGKKRKPHPMPTKFRLTRSGWLFLLVTMLVGLAALKNQSALLYVLFGAMLAAAQLSAVIASNSLRYLELRRQAPSRVWQNQAVPMAYYVRNLKGRWCLGLTIEEVPPPRRNRRSKTAGNADMQAIHAASGYCASLPAHTVFRAGARFVATQRGRVSLDNVQVATDFPFGLVHATRRFADAENFQDIIVWPAMGRLKHQLLPHGAVELSSSAPSRATGGQDEFAGLREYRQDDNPRWIHWRRSAGRSELVVREMARPRPRTLWVVLDTHLPDRTAEADERRERAIRLAATIVEDALAQGYRVGAVLAHRGQVRVIPPAERRAQRVRLLDALAEVEDGPAPALAATLAHLRPGWLRQ
ncbi:MAG: DUF58 domain-containing protein, partial [Planctomycetaceae bacterium]